MSPVDLTLTVGFLVALSAASEQIVDFFKTLMNGWLGTSPATDPPPGEAYPAGEIARRISLIGIAFGAAWFSAAWFAGKDCTSMSFDMLGDICIGDSKLPVVVAGILGTAGSKFWKDVLGYVNAVRKTSEENLNMKRVERASMENTIGVQAHAVPRR